MWASMLCLLPSPPAIGGGFGNPQFGLPKFHPFFCCRHSWKTFCVQKEKPQEELEGFSVLSSVSLWDSGSIWSTMGTYFFSLHIPLSFGGLSVLTQFLGKPVLDPQTVAVSLVVIQSIELLGALALLKYSATHPFKLSSFFSGDSASKRRNSLKASAVGVGSLMVLVFSTSFVADRLVGHKDVSNPIVKEILASGDIARTSCFLVYCFITPLLEEIIYRGFLLSSLASYFEWQWAVMISAGVFSIAHFSTDNFIQLFLIGCVLGSTYCWTGNLWSSFTVHSLYNAVTLGLTILS